VLVFLGSAKKSSGGRSHSKTVTGDSMQGAAEQDKTGRTFDGPFKEDARG